MGLTKFWNEYELYFYCEFINDSSFPESKKNKLQQDMGSFFINNDFTIYQKKTDPIDKITETDFRNNFITFLRILIHLPISKVVDFLEFHLDKYQGDKLTFLKFIYHEFKGSKHTQGGKEVPRPQAELILFDWCESKFNELEPKVKTKQSIYKKTFVHKVRIEQLTEIKNSNYDLNKLIKILEEINDNYSLGNFYSVAMLGRSVINHIPPVFGFKTFNEVSNNYGTKSFKKNMSHLNISMRSIADNYLHDTIRKKESLPNENQVDFSRDLDVLLGEIIIKLSE